MDNLGGPLGSSALYSPDERFDAMHRFDRLNPSSMQQQSGYMLENSQTWGYNNAGGAATMNGPLNGNGRIGSRPVNRRAALPTVSRPGLRSATCDVC